MRVSQEFDFFSLVEDRKMRVRVFDLFFTSVLKANASASHKPPADYTEVTELACMALRQFGYAGMKPLETTFFMAQSSEYAKQVVRANTGDKPEREKVPPRPTPKNDRAGKKLLNVVGKLPSLNEQYRMGKEVFCKQYQFGRCKRETARGGCKLGSIESVHKCATIKSLRSDNTPRLCALGHAHNSCPDKT